MNKLPRCLILSAALATFLVSAPESRAQPQPVEGAGAEPAVARSSRLQGRAALSRRNPVMGATVRIQPQDDASLLYLTSTGNRGEFRVDGLPDGEYHLRITRDGLAPIRKEGITVKFPFRAVVELTMGPDDDTAAAEQPRGSENSGTVTVLGNVLEQGGEPLDEVMMRLVRPDGTEAPRSLRTVEEGRFEVQDFPAGPWRVEVHGIGFLPVRQVMEFDRDSQVTVYLVRQPAGYKPSPLELMPPERPIPPDGWAQ